MIFVQKIMTPLKPHKLFNSRFDGVNALENGTSAERIITDPAQFELPLKLILISLLTLTVFLLFFTFREYDNNRLLSWGWVMSNREALWIILLSIGIMGVGKFLQDMRLRVQPLLFFTAFIIAMSCWSTPEVIIDSARYFTHAKYLMNNGLFQFLSAWGSEIDAWTDLPMVSIIYGLAFQVFGESRVLIQVINTLFFSFSIVIVFHLGNSLWSRPLGLYAAIMLLSIPFLHIQTSQMLVDVPSMFFVELAMLVSLIAVKKGGIKLTLVASLIIALAVLTKYSAWLVLSSVLLMPFALDKDQRLLGYKRILGICIGSGVLLGGIFFVYHDLILTQITLLFSYNLPALERWQESYVSTFFYQIHPFITIMAVISVFLAAKNKDAGYLVILCGVASFFALGVERARYLIIIFPMFAVLGAYGLHYINQSTLKNYILFCVFAVSVSITVVANKPFLSATSSANLKSSAEYLNTLSEQGVVVYALEQPRSVVNPQLAIPIMDYYTNKEMFLDKESNEVLRSSASDSNSPVRFTWEVEIYPYKIVKNYQNNKNVAIAMIMYDNKQSLPGYIKSKLTNFRLDKKFYQNDKIFRYQTVVSIYRHRDNV